ncbi:hypothetical protein GGI24_005980, partial [Coemansia furcata]
MELWHENITNRSRDANNNVQLPQCLTDLGPYFLRYFLFDPFSQTCDWACLPAGAWPPALQAAQRICIDNRFPQTVDFCNTLSTGSSLMRPALACAYDVRELFDGRTAESRYFFEDVALYYESTPLLQNRPFFTVAAIETIADRIRIGAATAPMRERERRIILASHLVEYVNLHRGTPRRTSAEELARPHMLNWSYGPPRTTPPPDMVVRQYAFANAANRAWTAPAPAARPHATAPIAIPFAMWSNHGAVRRLLDGAPPLVYPSVTLSGNNFSLPRFNATCMPWKAIKKLHATPEVRNTVHRLSINRIPKRQGLFPRECHCGALETVAHLTGICRDFAPLRDQFFPRWIALAHTLVPTIRDELQDAATEAARIEAAEKHTAAVERAMATNAPPPAPNTQRLIINISLPWLLVVPPELDNW